MKNSFIIAVSAALLAALLVSCKQNGEPQLQYYQTPFTYDIVNVQEPPQTNEVKNIIFMIGDGMGLEQVSCAWVLNKGKLNIDNFTSVGLSRTSCTNALITDSGAGGTALAAGQKTAYSHVGTDADTTDLYSILVDASRVGKSTGVAVTCHFADATPCADVPTALSASAGWSHETGNIVVVCGSLFLAGEALVALGAFPWPVRPADTNEILTQSC